MAEETQPLQPQQAPPTQPQQAPPQNAIMAVGGNLKNFAVNVLKEVCHMLLGPADARYQSDLTISNCCRGNLGLKWWIEAPSLDQQIWQR